MTRTQTDSMDPSLPEAQSRPAPLGTPAALSGTPAVPISGDVAAEIARQLSDTNTEPVKGQRRIYAVRESAGTMLPNVTLQPMPTPSFATHNSVDETAVLNRMLTMNRSQVMRGVEDAVKHTDSTKGKARHANRRGSTHIEAERLNPEAGNGMRRIDPDPQGKEK